MIKTSKKKRRDDKKAKGKENQRGDKNDFPIREPEEDDQRVNWKGEKLRVDWRRGDQYSSMLASLYKIGLIYKEGKPAVEEADSRLQEEEEIRF